MNQPITHPSEQALALLAGDDAGPIRLFMLKRHVRVCPDCQEKVTEYRDLRAELATAEGPDLNWKQLEAEMRANIHVGFEAGQCVREVAESRLRNPRLAVAFACLLVLAAAGFFLRESKSQREPMARIAGSPSGSAMVQTTMLQSGPEGLELSSGAASITLLSHRGAVINQTVSAQGEIRARYVDGETGSVTINNVYLQ